jgi:hypothetical protein
MDPKKDVKALPDRGSEDRIAPAIVLVNPAGNTPQGTGRTTGRDRAQNPAGHAPPGHN